MRMIVGQFCDGVVKALKVLIFIFITYLLCTAFRCCWMQIIRTRTTTSVHVVYYYCPRLERPTATTATEGGGCVV